MIDKEMLEAIGQMMDTKLDSLRAEMSERFDKVGERMSSIEDDMRTLKADNAEIREDLRTLKADNAEIREDLQSVKADTARLVTMEKTLGLLMEAQVETREKVKKLDKVADDVEEIRIRVSALEGVTKENTSQIKDIRIAK